MSDLIEPFEDWASPDIDSFLDTFISEYRNPIKEVLLSTCYSFIDDVYAPDYKTFSRTFDEEVYKNFNDKDQDYIWGSWKRSKNRELYFKGISRNLYDYITNYEDELLGQNQDDIDSCTETVTASKYINMGDRNPYEGTIIVEPNYQAVTCNVLYIQPYEDDLFICAWCFFDEWDVTNGWIKNKVDQVSQAVGHDIMSCDLECLAADCINYFGIENFEPSYIGQDFGGTTLATRDEVADELYVTGIK